MRLHHYGILAATILLLGILAGYSLFKNNAMPVAMVNGDVIMLREVKENAEVGMRLYEQDSTLIHTQDSGLARLFEEKDEKALFARALESSIMNAILRSSVPKETQNKAKDLALQSVTSADVHSLAPSLQKEFGWDSATFRERVIEPQILRGLISEAQGESYDEWTQRVRLEADVSLWFVPFDWVNGNLIEK